MTESLRITDHPILGPASDEEKVTIYFDGKPIEAVAGEPIAAALMAAGVKSFRTTERKGEPRGIFCAIGRCTDCMMIVDGRPNVRTCVTSVADGMHVETQHGIGVIAIPQEAQEIMAEKAESQAKIKEVQDADI